MAMMVDDRKGEGDALDEIYAHLSAGLSKRGININDIINSAPTQDQELAALWTRCTILPEDNIDTPLRYHSPSNQFPTAALGIVDFRAVKWQFQPNKPDTTGKPGANTQMGPTDMGIFTFDDNPLNIACIYDPNPNYSPCVYDWTFNGNTLMRWTQSGSIQANKAMSNISDPTNVDFHGLYLYTQYDKQNNRYFWVDCRPGSVNGAGTATGSTITVTLPGLTVTPTDYLFTIGLYRYFGGNPKLCQQIVIDNTVAGAPGGGQVTFTLTGNTIDPANARYPTYSDYYTVRIVTTRTRTSTPPDALFVQAEAVILGGLQVQSKSLMSVLRHIAFKEVEALLPMFSEKGRMNAMAMRLTDVPMLQYQNGLISGFVCVNGNSWYQYFQNGLQGADSFFNKVATAVGAKVHEIWKGGYMWHKSADDTFYFWQRWVNWDENTRAPSDLGVNLETTRPVNIMAMNATNDFTDGNPNGGGCIGAATWSCMIEWMCPISIYPQEYSPFTTEACQKGIDAAGKFPSFVENDAHWDKFLAYSAQVADHGAPLWKALIQSGEDRLARWNPKVAKAAGDVARKGLGWLAGRNAKRAR